MVFLGRKPRKGLPLSRISCSAALAEVSYFETIAASHICPKLISHVGKELLYRVDLANKCIRFPERAKIVDYQVTIRVHFRGMSSPVSRVFC